MKSLYLRIWLTVVVALAAFALVSGALVQRTLAQERERIGAMQAERLAGWGELISRSLPGDDQPPDVQARVLEEWSQRLRLPLALDDAQGRRLVTTDAFRRQHPQPADTPRREFSIELDDGRTLHVIRMLPPRPPNGPPGGFGPFGRGEPLSLAPGVGLAVLLVVLFLAVAGGAYPVVRRLTRRLEALRVGVEAFGAGALGRRVDADGDDDVAALAVSFNRAAQRIESLVQSNRHLLANASHELRSPLARLKMALGMLDGATPARRASLQEEIATNIAELDALVEEVLLASRLEATPGVDTREAVDLLAVAAEEAARVGVSVEGEALSVPGDERLLRRAVRNLLENAHRYGGRDIDVHLTREPTGVALRVGDRGPGVPPESRERIFEPFFRLPGHAEREGGVGLGLALVRQIAGGHGGSVRCEGREGGGSVFVLSLPAA